MSNQLQLTAFDRKSLNRLPTEIKEMIVAMVDRQDTAYQKRIRMGIKLAEEMPRDESRLDFADSRDGVNLVGKEYAGAEDGSNATCDERRKWRRLLGKGVSSVFRVNREFAALAAPHLFTVCRSESTARRELTLVYVDILLERVLSPATQRSRTSPSIPRESFHDARFKKNRPRATTVRSARLACFRHRYSASERSSTETGWSIRNDLHSTSGTAPHGRRLRSGEAGRNGGSVRGAGVVRNDHTWLPLRYAEPDRHHFAYAGHR